MDGSTTISPVESQQPADTDDISALDQSFAGKDTKNSNIIQEKDEKTSSAEGDTADKTEQRQQGAEGSADSTAVSDNNVPGEVKPAEQLKPIDLRDAVRVESPEIGVSEANAKAQFQSKVKGWLTDENIEWVEGKDLDEIIDHFGNTPEPIAVLPALVRQNVPTLADDYLYYGKAYFIDHHANHHPELDIDEYDNIQTILDSFDDIKIGYSYKNGEINITAYKFIYRRDRYAPRVSIIGLVTRRKLRE